MNIRHYRLVSLVASFGLVVSACAPAAPEAPEAPPAEEVGEKPFRIGLVTDVGEVDDKSFNQSAWEGAQAGAAAVGGSAEYIETQDAKDYAANIGEFAEQGYDVIVTVGFALGQATIEAAVEYPDVDFIGVDQFQGEETSGVAGLIFPEAKAGFMAGALAANMSQSGTIAAVLGTDLVPPVVFFKEGYENGARYVNPDINILSTYHPGGLDVAFTDPEWGASTAAQAIDQGADVIFGAGGKTGNGALIEVASRDGLYCIGVDTDQWGTVPEAHPCLITSAMKMIDKGVVELIDMASSGNFPSGNFVGGFGLAPFHDFDSAVPADVKADLDAIRAGLVDGSIDPMPATAAAALKVAFVYVAPIGDLGWTWAHDQGRKSLEDELGAETAYIEMVPEGPEGERVIRDFAMKGYDLIFTTSFGYMDPTITVAEEFPDTQFVHISGFKQAPNSSSVFGRMYQPRYLSGLVAGAATDSNIIGYVAAFPIPEVIRGINAFTLGVREANPAAEVRVVWTNTWFGPPEEKEAADALLAAGADIIAQHQDTTEPQKAAADAGALSIGYDSDMAQFVGDTVLTSPIWNWGVKYVEIAEQVMAGTYDGSESYWGGMTDGIVALAPLSDRVSDDTAALVEEKTAAIISGDWDVFCGPITGANGSLVVAKGQCLDDGSMLGMDYWVDGVSGEVPGEAPGEAPVAEVTEFVIAHTGPIYTMDAPVTWSGSTHWLAHTLYDCLIGREQDGSGFYGQAAESWEIIDPVTWRFHLRPGLTFHNGEPLDAEAVKWNIDRTRTREDFQVMPQWAFVKEVKVIDAVTLDVITDGPEGYTEWNISFHGCQIMPPKYMEEVGEEEFARHPVGSGPYKLVEFTSSERYVFEAWDDYHGGRPEVDRVVYQVIPESSSQIAALLAGQIHLVPAVPMGEVERVEAADGVTVVSAPAFRTTNLQLRTQTETGAVAETHPDWT